MLPIPVVCLLLAIAVGLYFAGLHLATASGRTPSEDSLGILMVIVAILIAVVIAVDWVVTWGNLI